MSIHRYCDGITRRDFVRVGVLGGMSLAASWQQAHAGAATAKSAIFVYLGGGPSHMDSFDLKPDATAEVRGEFNPIATKAPGMQICEHLPKLAAVADQFTLLRGVTHTLAGHELGTEYMNTGSRPIPSLVYPGYGAVITKELPGDPQLPHFVAVPTTPQKAGYLGVRHAALQTNNVPTAGTPFSVRGISLGNGLTVEQFEKRANLLRDLDTTFQTADESKLIDGLDRFSQQAYDMIRSSKARQAFDTSLEKPEVAQRFGTGRFGMSCLLAARLIEAGTRYVTVSFGGWDTHFSNFGPLKTSLLPQLDEGLSGLLTTLSERGLLATTTIYVTGEFGRTPKINARGGRDHWPRAMAVLMAGGGIKGGQVLGASDSQGMGPAGTGYTPDQVAASYYHTLGIDHAKEYHTATGRPIMIVRDGSVIRELFA